jgi:hypothetical protein
MNDLYISKFVKVIHDKLFYDNVQNGFDRVHMIGKFLSIILLLLWIYLMIMLYKRVVT